MAEQVTRARSWTADAALYAGVAVVSTIVAIWSYGLFDRTWSRPLFYASDALAGGAAFKTVLETGWYEHTTSLGAPLGQNYHAFPVADHTQFLMVRAVGLFTDDWAIASNLTHILGFGLAAVCGAWFFRVVGLTRVTAAGFALLFAFAPYHFVQGYGHLSLSLYFPVALIGAVMYRLLMGEPIWGTKEGAWPVRWVTWRSAGTLAAVLLLGTTSSYYSVFALVLLAFVGVVLALRRAWRALGGLVVAMGGLMAAMLVNMLPDLLYRGPANYLSFARQPLESELYALKFSALVLPTPWSRFGGLGEWRMHYEWDFPLPSERPVLGLVAAVGFLFLLLLPILRGVLVTTTSTPSELVRRQSALSALTFVAFFFGTVGGLATLFALLVSPSIRAWNRISIYLMLFALAAVALLVEAGVRRIARRRSWSPRRLRAGLGASVAVLTVIGLVDQVAPSTWGLTGTEAEEWRIDEAYADGIAARLPAGALVLQAPFMAFPESQPINEMEDYEHFRPYLHTSGLRWTYGGIKGLPRSSWSARTLAEPVEEMLIQAAAVGVQGIHVDRFGYPGRDAGELEPGIEKITGAEPWESEDQRYAFYDISDYAQEVVARLGAEQTAFVRRRVLSSPEIFWEPDFAAPHPEGVHQVSTSLAAGGTVTIGNPGGAFEGRLRMVIRADGAAGPTPMTITLPDGTQENVTVPLDGFMLDRDVTIPAGRSTLTLARADDGVFSLIDPRIVDRALARAVRQALLASTG